MANNTAAAEESWKLEKIHLAVGFLEVTLSLVIFFANGLTLVALRRYKKLHTKTNVLVASLAVADVLVGIATLIEAARYFEPKYFDSKYPCLLMFSIFLISADASLFGILGITIERYVAISDPLRYHSRVTFKRVLWLSAGSWLYSAVVGLLPLAWNRWTRRSGCLFAKVMQRNYVIVFNSAEFLLVSAVVAVLYWRILKIARTQQQKTESVAAARQKLRKESRAARMFVLVVGAFLFCWIPLVVLLPIECIYTDSEQLEYASYFTEVFTLTNSFMNPLIYGWRNRDFRSAYRKLFPWPPDKRRQPLGASGAPLHSRPVHQQAKGLSSVH